MKTPLPPYSCWAVTTLALLADEVGQVHRGAPVRGAPLDDAAGPGDVGRDGLALLLVEEALQLVVGEHGEDGLLVDGLAAEGIHQ
jgi:hypothetical protein